MSSLTSKLPLGTLNGGAQDDVELVIARDILKHEAEMGQAPNTVSIPNLVSTLNQRRQLVPPEKEATLAANVKSAYTYAAEQVPLSIRPRAIIVTLPMKRLKQFAKQ